MVRELVPVRNFPFYPRHAPFVALLFKEDAAKVPFCCEASENVKTLQKNEKSIRRQ
jgi:hypothetical protein